ncbi:MAG: hypothetical protein K2M91_14940, partial [Lachnospiraceae bacterium]|nr:hypothetical protein [Lachnospiraceae bacterium]
NNTSEAENTSVQKKTLRYDEKNKGNIKAFDDQRLDAFEREKEYSHMLDDSYRMTMQVFENDNYSIKDRVDAYQSFMNDSRELAENREIERYLKINDYRAATDLQIKTLSNQRINTVAKTTENGQKKYVPVDNILRSVGQAMVEEAAKEKEKTKTAVE